MDISAISPDIISDMIAFGPDMLQLIEIELQTRKITYQKLAQRIHSASGTVACWFSRGAIPADKLFSVVAAVDSAGLWMKVLSRIPGNAFCTLYLDNTDDHPLTALDEAIESAELFLLRARMVKAIVRHKKTGYIFEEDEARQIAQLEDIIADCLSAKKMVLVRMEDHYDRSVRDIMARQAQRMKARGYCTSIKEKTAIKAVK